MNFKTHAPARREGTTLQPNIHSAPRKAVLPGAREPWLLGGPPPHKATSLAQALVLIQPHRQPRDALAERESAWFPFAWSRNGRLDTATTPPAEASRLSSAVFKKNDPKHAAPVYCKIYVDAVLTALSSFQYRYRKDSIQTKATTQVSSLST
jgi:hypothetical protein